MRYSGIFPKAILCLLERDMGHWSAGRRHLQSQRQVRQGEVFLHPKNAQEGTRDDANIFQEQSQNPKP